MKGINKAALIKKFRGKAEMYPLRNGGSVIGQEIDEENRLVYVVKRKDGTVDVTLAERELVILRIISSSRQTKKIHIDLSAKQPEEPIEGFGKKGGK
jgi:hypothetical protein